MIVRMVKMTFHPDKVDDFYDVFNGVYPQIRSFEGCAYLELHRHLRFANILYTYSYWESETALETYRQSDLFAKTWKVTKSYFCAPPEAWSMVSHMKLP